MQHLQVDIGSAQIACQIRGTGSNIIIIEPAIHSCSAEWWPLAALLAEKSTVITYDRIGYGKSTNSSYPRTAECIVKELSLLIEKLKIETPIIFVAHSHGAFYVQEYARKFPARIKGMVLVDPITIAFPQLRFSLKHELYKKSGIDRSNSLTIPIFLGRLGLLGLFKKTLMKLPPLIYYEFENEAKRHIQSHKLRLRSYLVARKEQRCFYDCIPFIADNEQKPFPEIPLKILYHSPAFMINEMMHYGPLTKYQATEIEQHWLDMTSKAIELSALSSFTVARFSGNYMHLTEQNLIIDAVNSLLD